ncbi:hypothetical protein SAMN05443661_1765 [Natronobacterium gregoryi]|uniref:Uncharacterized protein n=2 Tax=Natronobacterium gregoryi TaxID=44930 RepID=L0AP58_NATGS|nr:hypothetical protein Natgr_3789 [Natronobacterium gregoryi SP2]SFJ75105.1 hypothetical protein SAMN05443661_1765 [Natronobacterium gregoryi]
MPSGVSPRLGICWDDPGFVGWFDTAVDAVSAIFFQGENPVVYDGRESDTADTDHVQQLYGYLSRIVS